MTDLVVIPLVLYRKARKSLSDIRNVPLAYQPPALTRPGERWNVNAYDLTQILVVRDDHQRIVARFETTRDALAAAQSRAITEEVVEAVASMSDDAEIGRVVRRILREYGR